MVGDVFLVNCETDFVVVAVDVLTVEITVYQRFLWENRFSNDHILLYHN